MTAQNLNNLEAIATFFTGEERLSYDAIDVKPIDYRFAEESYDFDEEGEGWRIVYHPTLEEQLDNCEEIDEDGVCVEVPDCDGEIRLTVEEEGPLAEAWLERHGLEQVKHLLTIQQAHPAWRALVKLFDLDPNAFEEDGDEEDWGPMMNYAYPLPRGVLTDVNWHRCMNNCTVVEINGETYLALTGGGMDLTWEISETYLRCGYLPPLHFCDLPRMAGRGTSERDRFIIAACKLSAKVAMERAQWRLEALQQMEQDETEKAS